MRARGIALLLALCLLPLRLAAQEIVADLSQYRVSIDARFDGSQILIFGAVKRDGSPEAAKPVDVVVTVAGPPELITVRRKERVAGIWINTRSVDMTRVPSFYKIATSAPLPLIVSEETDREYRISIPRAVQAEGSGADYDGVFPEALIRIRSDNGLYALRENAVRLRNDTLFRTEIGLPANLVEGDYTTRIFLMREGELIARYETQIGVRKVGLERFLYTLAHEQALIYALVSLFIAIVAGWSASALFRYVRG